MVKFLKEKGLECTGCAACVNVCPVDAILIEYDSMGFQQPVIREDLCIHCDRCKEVCPVLQEFETGNHMEPACFAVMADDDVRSRSSSGGAFYVFAQKILERGGVVVGATLEEDLTVRHMVADSLDEFLRLQKSKYVQSEIGLIYRTVKQYLDGERDVLFSGCPCQIAGLKAYLNGNTEHLYTMDIFCHGVPSAQMLQDSLDPVIGLDQIQSLDFRDKNYGWECLGMTVSLKDGSKVRLSYDESRYEQGFHPGMTLRESCYDCKFCSFPRVGDISIGDFWRVEEHDPSLSDGKGTSVLLVNSDKGDFLFRSVQSDFQMCKDVPLELTQHNRVTPKIPKDKGRPYFSYLYQNHDFNTSVLYAQQTLFDIGLVGNWSYPNYGSELTYYALYSQLKQWGYSVWMISWPKKSHWKPYEEPQLFKENPYMDFEIAPLVETRDDLRNYSHRCQTFVLGSDQLLNNNLYNWFDKFMQMDWVQSNKRKIAYAASYGCDYIWGSDEDRAELSYFMQQFDSFSVREQDAVLLSQKNYGITPECVLDPVFLPPISLYEDLIAKCDKSMPSSPYLFTYILDISPEKRGQLPRAAQDLEVALYAALDGAEDSDIQNVEWDINTVYGLRVEEWLSYIKNCKYMITDSFHGMCFAILFKKPFLAICNNRRGKSRFTSILDVLGLQERLVTEADFLDKIDLLNQEIDYEKVLERQEGAVTKSIEWLKNALQKTLPPKQLSPYDLVANHKDRNAKYNLTMEKNWELECRLNWSVQKEQELEDKDRELENKDRELENKDRELEDKTRELENRCNMLGQKDMDLEDKFGWLDQKDREFEDRCNMFDQKARDFEDNHTVLAEKLKTYEESFKGEQDRMTAVVFELNCRIQALTESKSFKLGRMITYLPRKIRDFFRKRMV